MNLFVLLLWEERIESYYDDNNNDDDDIDWERKKDATVWRFSANLRISEK